ncbi:MAG: dihydropteridine reductase [Clostridiales bacterium]|nr:dihydropteridine reductase [Clostridiales bacterium]
MNTDKIYAESIANEYSVKETSKVVALKKLDRKAKSTANIFAYTFGIVSALVLGIGMCLAMGEIGSGTQMSFICGIIIGIIGIVGAGINYPIYKKLKKHGMDRYAGDIIRLANEISEIAE